MTPDSLDLLAVLLTYGLHSTVFLGGAWLLSRGFPGQSALASDVLWKVALVGGLVTTGLSGLLGTSPLGGAIDLHDSELSRPAALERLVAPGEGLLPLRQARLSLGPDELPAVGAERSPVARTRAAKRSLSHGTTRNVSREPRAPVAGASAPAGVRRRPAAVKPLAVVPEASHEVDRSASSRNAEPLAASAASTAGPWSAWTPAVLVALVWAGVTALTLGRCVLRRRTLRRLLADRQPVSEPRALAILERLTRRAGWRRPVALSVSSALAGPVALGRREIVLPPRALTALDEDGLTAVLAHELAHVVRGDGAWLALGDLLSALFWFQPLHRLGRERLAEVAEWRADDWAVARTGRPRTFAQTLAQVAGWIVQSRPTGLVPGMARPDSSLVVRVRRLAEGRPARRRHLGLVAALVLVLGASCGVPVIRAGDDDGLLQRLARGLQAVLVQATPQAVQPVVQSTSVDEVSPVVAPLAAAPRPPAPPADDDHVRLELRGDVGFVLADGRLSAVSLGGRDLAVSSGENGGVILRGEGLTLHCRRLDLRAGAGRETSLVLELPGREARLLLEPRGPRDVPPAPGAAPAPLGWPGPGPEAPAVPGAVPAPSPWPTPDAPPEPGAGAAPSPWPAPEAFVGLDELEREYERAQRELEQAWSALEREHEQLWSESSSSWEWEWVEAEQELEHAWQEALLELEQEQADLAQEWARLESEWTGLSSDSWAEFESEWNAASRDLEESDADEQAWQAFEQEWELAEDELDRELDATWFEWEQELEVLEQELDLEWDEVERQFEVQWAELEQAFDAEWADLEQGWEFEWEQAVEELEAEQEALDLWFEQSWEGLDCDHDCESACADGCTHPDEGLISFATPGNLQLWGDGRLVADEGLLVQHHGPEGEPTLVLRTDGPVDVREDGLFVHGRRLEVLALPEGAEPRWVVTEVLEAEPACEAAEPCEPMEACEWADGCDEAEASCEEAEACEWADACDEGDEPCDEAEACEDAEPCEEAESCDEGDVPCEDAEPCDEAEDDPEGDVT